MTFEAKDVECIDLERSKLPISTGVGFLDHMIDQFNSHAQVGVAITVAADGPGVSENGDKHNRFADQDQSQLLPLCGAQLGKKMRLLLDKVQVGAVSRFCCPLDEALVECRLTRVEGEGKLVEFTLAPYGIYPKSTGRTKIGQMITKDVEGFMRALCQESGLDMSLLKIRGHNGHHIVESAFKALSRSLRNLIDGTSTNESTSESFQILWGLSSPSWNDSICLQREAKVERNTKETTILVDIKLDGGVSGIEVETGIDALNQFFYLLAAEAQVSLKMECRGDLWIDDHHTSEDVSIALGQVLTKALGTKAGLNRMWCAQAQFGNAIVEATMDLSNRPCLTHNLSLSDEEYVEGVLTVEMLDHVLDSLVVNARMTAHLVEVTPGTTVKETVLASAMAFGRALRMCAAVDPRRAGKTASSKGTLSV